MESAVISTLWIFLALSILGRPAASPNAVACPVGGQPGVYSKLSTYLCFQDLQTGRRHLDVASPNEQVHYVINGDHGRFYLRGRAIGKRFSVGRDEEIIWSPDSKAIITTLSFGSAGPTSAGVAYVNEERLGSLPDVTQEIRRGFALRHPKLECADNANVAGLGWMHDSTTALFVAQIPPIPDCGRTWGYFDVYAVSVRTGRIVGVYPMAEALMRFKRLLGPGVRRDVPEPGAPGSPPRRAHPHFRRA